MIMIAKVLIGVLLAAAIVLSVLLVMGNRDFLPLAPNGSLEARMERIEKRVAALEQSKPASLVDELRTRLSNVQRPPPIISKEPPPEFVVAVDFSSAGKDAIDNPLIFIRVEVTNKSGKDIDLVNAIIAFKDTPDNTIARIKWQDSKGFKKGETVGSSGSYSFGYKDNSTDRLLKLDRKFLRAEFEVYKIAFSDGRVVEYRQCATCDF